MLIVPQLVMASTKTMLSADDPNYPALAGFVKAGLIFIEKHPDHIIFMDEFVRTSLETNKDNLLQIAKELTALAMELK